MKYIKKFGKITDINITIGDYVICTDNISVPRNDFIKDKIGRYVAYNKNGVSGYKYMIEYDLTNITSYLSGYIWKEYNNAMVFKISDILYCSNNKEELEMILATNKYNL